MIKELVLTAEELFYLGKLYEGKYLNYAYIAAMEDMGDKRSFRNRCRESLIAKGFIEMDLMGTVTFDEEVKELLSPVYFGDFCAEIHKLVRDGAEQNERFYIHCQNKKYLLLSYIDAKYVVRTMNAEDMENLVEKIFTGTETAADTVQIKEDELEEMLVVKNAKIGFGAKVQMFYSYHSCICERIQDGDWRFVSPEEYKSRVLTMLKGDAGFGL